MPADREATRRSRSPPVEVTGVIAVMGERGGFTVKAQPLGVVVVTRKEVGKWLARQHEVLADARMIDAS